ncbi:hypothetical protein Pla52o_04010 [Novipirellula galeiformis]|uniref:Uncharacterized protein n=2 Tax=Novipirellula galeiformis TaxID=2528004 RepID=A0A5C6CQG3_9BACT|nr:hypothetical protein Pla52o_04010 [Novipirellula galeiformis]
MHGELFDPQAELLVHDRLRPHWSQSGAIVFVTFRCIDSIPKSVLQRWDREKNDWLRRRGLLKSRHWSDVLSTLEAPRYVEFSKQFNRCREDSLSLVAVVACCVDLSWQGSLVTH